MLEELITNWGEPCGLLTVVLAVAVVALIIVWIRGDDNPVGPCCPPGDSWSG